MPVVLASQIANEDWSIDPIYKPKDKTFRLVKVKNGEGDAPLLIQFSGEGGSIPVKFGVDTNERGKTCLNFSVTCEKESAAINQFQEQMKEKACANKKNWWSVDVTDNQVKDNFIPLLPPRKEKKESEGFWPSNIRVTIPLDDNGLPKDCVVVNDKEEVISIHEIAGRKWQTVMIEISGIYFQNKYNWGFGPKVLRLLKLREENSRPQGPVDYLNLILRPPLKTDEEGAKKRKREEVEPSDGNDNMET